MSRFFNDQAETTSSEEWDSSSDYSEESFHYTSSEDEDNQNQEDDNESTASPKKSNWERYAQGSSDDESSSDDQRQVKSQKLKKKEQVEMAVEKMLDAFDFDDWTDVLEQFEFVMKKTPDLVRESGGRVPHFLLKGMVDLRNGVTATQQSVKDGAVMLTSLQAKAFNAVRQKEKKFSKNYDREIEEYLKNPDQEVQVVTVAPVETSQKVDFDPKKVLANLEEIMSNRGKKNTDRMEQIRLLEQLKQVAQVPVERVRVLISLVSSIFDVNLSLQVSMNVDLWKSAENFTNEMMTLLENHPEIKVGENVQEYDEFEPVEEHKLNIRTSLLSFLLRLDDEFAKSLHSFDSLSSEYVDRLGDELTIYKLCKRFQSYFTDDNESLVHVIIRRLEHLYFKTAQVIEKTEAICAIPGDTPMTAVELIDSLSEKLSSNNRVKYRGQLYRVYHHALHGRFDLAKDLFLNEFNLPDMISSMDVSLQILYNRTLVQLGLSAFCTGNIRDAHQALMEISCTGKVKELLAQGVTITRPGDSFEKPKQLPLHVHINVELVECVYLTSAMLLEVPNMAAAKSKVISKTLRRLLDLKDKNTFSAPPENTRDYIIAAAKALSLGEWKQCLSYIMTINLWNLLPNSTEIRKMLSQKIREQGLCTFMLSYGKFYDSISLEFLSKMFDLELDTLHSLVGGLINDHELNAQVENGMLRLKCESSNLVHQCQEQLALFFDDQQRLSDLLVSRNTDRRHKFHENSVPRRRSSNARDGIKIK